MNSLRIFWFLSLALVCSIQPPSDAHARISLFPRTNYLQSPTIPLSLQAPPILFTGDILLLAIQIGNSDSLVTDLFGLSFRLNYDSAKWLQVIPDSDGKIVAPGEFWPQNTFIFSRQDTLLNQFQVGITQLAGTPGSTGTGRVAWLHFKIHPQTPDSTLLNFWLTDIVAINSQKDTLQLRSDEIKVMVYEYPVFKLSCQPRYLSINWGEIAHYQIFLDSVRYLREKVTLSCEANPELLAEIHPRQISKSDTAQLSIRTQPEIFRKEDFKIVVQGHISQFVQVDTVRLQMTSPPSFRIRVKPDIFTIFAGDSLTSHVYLDSVWNCEQEIQLTCQNLPADVGSGYFNQNAIFPGDSIQFRIRTNLNAPPGEYWLKIIGQGNNYIDSTNLILRIVQKPNFSLVVAPDFQSIFAGQKAKFTVKLDSLINFHDDVHLKISNFPSDVGEVTIQPDSIASNDIATITIYTTLTTASGVLSPVITGTASGMMKTASFSLEILPQPDFVLNVNPLERTIVAGESTFFQIQIESLHNFQDSVVLNYSLSGSSFDAQIEFKKRKISPGQHTELSIVTSLQTKPAEYHIKILAVTDSLSHEQLVNLVVNAPPLAAEWILPNPFTPNQDGFNDQVQFNLHHIETDGLILIFNFRGQKVREIRHLSYWDGTDESGAALPMGIYFYMVKIQNELKARGSLTLVR